MNNRINTLLSGYDEYEAEFDPMMFDRQARKKRKPKVKHTPKKSEREIIEAIADTTALEGGFEMTYNPSRHEEQYLHESIRPFYDMDLITDVLAKVKGGKEANVYRCTADESVGHPIVAAKVYRPKKFRNLRNDKVYRQGRTILGADGKPVEDDDKRAMRAMDKGSAFGELLEHTSWLMYEFTTLEKLYKAGGSVPEPIMSSENALLMEYIGDAQMAAPTLNGISLDPDEAEYLFNDVMRNIELLLNFGMVHGDLSAYNILYWEGEITLIDFPQVVNITANSEARAILERDITRVCEYFSGEGVDCDPKALTYKYWRNFLDIGDLNRAADQSMLEYKEEEEYDD